MKYVILILEFIKSLFHLIFSLKVHRVILIGTPLHGNLGDHAIAVALKDLFKSRKICFVEIPGNLYRNLEGVYKWLIKKTDIICITGGGFLGSLWTVEDDMVLSILEKFKDNKIVIAPQSLFFYENDNLRIERTKTVYGNCKDLTVYLRESNSYELCKNLFAETPVKIRKCPDVVFSLNLNVEREKIKKNRILLCFRTDKEQCLSDFDKNLIKDKIASSNLCFENISTVVPYSVSSLSRKKELLNILKKIANSKLVITDRLHAMIFCYITETPCYVYDNVSKKISGMYEWINDCEYIHYCSSFDVDKINFDLKPGKKKNFSGEFEFLIKSLQVT